jgi:PAS domain S-box-containing protein
MRKVRNTEIYITLVAALAAAGFLLELLILLFALIPLNLPLSYNNIRLLFAEHNIFYLANLIPLLSAISGYFMAARYMQIRTKEKEHNALYKKSIENIVMFAKKIETGDFSHAYETVNGEEDLHISLENMRKSLLSFNQKESERAEIAHIIAEANELLRSVNGTGRLGDEIIGFLADRIEGVVQAAFYLAEEDPSAGKKLRMTSAYAFDRKKQLQSEFLFGQGLVGQAVLEKQYIMRTEIPTTWAKVTSGLIDHKKPVCILILPLIDNDIVYGVIELSSFQKFTHFQLRLLSELSEIITRTINIVKVNEKTLILLRESEKMRENLAQKTEMMQVAEEMIAARQEELTNTNLKLEEQIQEVYNINQKTQTLLENSLEVIFIYNQSGTTSYVSPSIQSVLGYYPDEVSGKSFTENIHPLDTTGFTRFINDIRSFPERKHKLQYRYFTRSGEIIWMEAIGKNSLDGVINGIIVTSRDISEQLLAEKEQRIRAKMQALSENSTDIIMRIDIFSRCTYVNPVIEKYTGLSISDFLNKPINSINLEESVIAFFKSTLEDVAKTRSKSKYELVFPVFLRNKIMDVSAIPEFYDNGEVESVLFVCHDITEARKREELIVKKNKSIKDSINYAYYIQSSLMPTEKDLQNCWPNSFMFYKPRDIVSGDYPWLYHDNDNIYIGAIDCTGHGVPGALMSIIGFFLQNEIIHNSNTDTAGEILDKLHTNLVRILRQEDEKSMINDGMDVSFCKIDIKNKTINYAGAHRPLYFIRNGELTEIRGDRFPVGSNQYSNRKKFTSHTFSITKGDAIFLTTDGFSDQYGGPSGKEKFMSGNVNILLKQNAASSIFQIGKVFRNTFEDWKGKSEQTDDILVIGLKF